MSKDNHDITVNIKGDASRVLNECSPEEVKEKIYEALKGANEILEQKSDDYVFHDTDNPFVKELKIPDVAYDENGDLKENYRKAYKTLIEKEREKHKALDIDEDDDLAPLEVVDSPTMDLKYLINNLIENTGIINRVELDFKAGHARTVLKTLSQQEQMLTDKGLKWQIQFDNDEEIRLIFNRR